MAQWDRLYLCELYNRQKYWPRTRTLAFRRMYVMPCTSNSAVRSISANDRTRSRSFLLRPSTRVTPRSSSLVTISFISFSPPCHNDFIIMCIQIRSQKHPFYFLITHRQINRISIILVYNILKKVSPSCISLTGLFPWPPSGMLGPHKCAQKNCCRWIAEKLTHLTCKLLLLHTGNWVVDYFHHFIECQKHVNAAGAEKRQNKNRIVITIPQPNAIISFIEFICLMMVMIKLKLKSTVKEVKIFFNKKENCK